MPRTSVLVVDDDNRNLLALREVLDDIADVVCASSGEEALRFLLKQQFAVIILDVLMPVMDGYETAQLIRSRGQTHNTPIIFLTAINKEDAHLLKGYDSGAVDYVFKPLEPLIIRSKVSVFVSLFEKTCEIERKAATEARLLQEKLEAEQERMRTLEALRASEEREAILLRSLPLALYVRDGIGKDLRFVSGNVLAITGFEADNFERQPELWRDRIHPDDLVRVDQPWASEEHNCEFRWRHAPGHAPHLANDGHKAAIEPMDEPVDLALARVLIVDDDIRNIYSLTSVLETYGIDVLHAERGQDGIDLLERFGDIDVALIDIMMPEMDGYETIREIRRRPHLADLPIISVTAKAMKGDRQKCLDAGASDYIAKPVDLDLLMALLRVWIGRARSEASSRPQLVAAK